MNVRSLVAFSLFHPADASHYPYLGYIVFISYLKKHFSVLYHKKAETAVLRRVNDPYQKIIYNAKVSANTSIGLYEKAVDMAIRTASKQAYLQREGQKRQEWGIHTVIVNKRGNPCPKCLPFVGKVLIDDVWSGGSQKDGNYPLMSYAIECGLYHPRCHDSHTTYFPGISTADDTWTKEELEKIGLANKQEARQQYASKQSDKYERLAKYSLDQENQERYKRKADEWKSIEKETIADIISLLDTKEVADVHTAGKIDREIYKCITEDIVTDEVIITDKKVLYKRE